MRNWRDLSYLLSGTARQRAAWEAISQIRLLDELKIYDPVLAGTLPLDIDIESSDLDIICTSADLDRFDRDVQRAYGTLDGYKASREQISGVPTSLITFHSGGFWFELFAQPVPVEKQNAFRHMDIEARLLSIGGTEAVQEIRRLKREGMKTEPAFALYFHIPGDDPYQALLQWETLSDDELNMLLHTRPS